MSGTEKETYVLDIVKEFRCMGSDCPYTCCRGWQIAIDDDTLDKYHKANGAFGVITYAACKKKKNGATVIRKVCGRCPFFTLKGLCGLQLKDKESYMPLVCRMFPRSSFVYGNRHEIALELSCYHASQLFVNNPARFHFEPSDKEYPIEWEAYDPEPAFVEYLCTLREQILDYFWSENENMDVKVHRIFDFANEVHKYIALDEIDKAKNLEIYKQSSRTLSGYAFLPISVLNKHIYGVMDESGIIVREPVIYKLMKRYKHYFGKLWEYEADAYFDKQIREMFASRPDIYRLVRAYFGYNVQQNIMVSCDDYYVLKQIAMSAVMTQYYMVFLLVAYMDGDTLDTDRQAEILSNMEKGISHNPFITSTILKSVSIYRE